MKIVVVAAIMLLPAISIAGEDSYIRKICTGGITGGGGGIMIYRDGRIIKLSKHRYYTPTEETVIGQDKDTAAKIFDLAETNGFLQTEYFKGGDIKCTLTYHTPEKEHTVRCTSQCLNGPEPIRQLFQALAAIKTSSSSKPDKESKTSTQPNAQTVTGR